MSLHPGTHLGPYEILAPIGAGGMGEVYKAKDTRLDRFVAIKVLPEHLAKHPESLARFEREAKAVAALNHPNITGIFDIGRVEDTAYAVMELLEGESLRTRLEQGPLTPRKATELAIQMAQGLAAAHEKGVVHRDLKPDNLWITKEGRLKILDFGLAKQVLGMKSGSDSFVPTAAISPGHQTEKGMILGTLGYMSPEQVRGESVDARSDIFSFGTVLFEMLAGKRAFARDTASDTMAAILRDDPPELEGTSRPIPLALRRVIEHCLEKAPARRFHDAEDLAFALENAQGGSSADSVPAMPAARLRSKQWALPLVLALVALLGGLAGWLARPPKLEPSMTQLTFRRGNVLDARFTSDGQSVVYAATWDGKPTELFLARLDGKATRPLGLAKADVLALNHQGEILVLLKGEQWGAASLGTLALMPLEGGAPRELLERVRAADFGPDGKELAVIYQPVPGGPQRLDYPLGKSLFELPYPGMNSIRVSPSGDSIALIYYDDETDKMTLALVDRQGKRRVLHRFGPSEFAYGPVWSPGGKEVYFTSPHLLRAVDLKGRDRVIRWDSGFAAVHDVSIQGRVLMERFIPQVTAVARRDGKDIDLSYSEFTEARALSADGNQALLNSSGGLGGAEGQVGIRQTDGSPPKLLGPGYGNSQSPDGKWVFIAPVGHTDVINLVPTGPGVIRELRHSGWTLLIAQFMDDGQHILIWGRKAKGEIKLLRFLLEGGPAEELPAKAPFDATFFSEDGRQILTLDERRRPLLRPLDGGEDRVLAPGLRDGETIIGWDKKDRLLVGQLGKAVSVSVDLLDLKSGLRKPWQVVGPADPSGVVSLLSLSVSLDFKTLVYSYRRVITSDLFVMDGIR